MVYCGKPSQGCGPCRAKKTRCDKGRPSCGQCIRTKTKCEGYRDDGDIMFRDQTRTVVSKAQASRKEHKARLRVDNPASFDDMKIVHVGHTQPTPASIPKAMLASLSDFASMSFYKQFMANGIAPGKDGLGLVPDTYVQAGAQSMLSELTLALGMVSHPLMGRDADVQILARKKYAKALSMTNKALGDPVKRLQDETLMTIIMLALYELITGSTPSSIKAWNAHVNGSINLLVLRGERQFQTTAGTAMFAHMKNRILVSCVQRCAPVPEKLLHLTRFFKPANDDELRASQIGDFTAQLCDIQSEFFNNAMYDGAELVRRLYGVDRQLSEWFARLPETYTPQVFSTEGQSNVFDDYYYTYETKFIAWVINNFLVIRIILNQWISGAISTLPNASTLFAQIESADDKVRADSTKICASVPFVMGDVAAPDGEKRPANLYGLSTLAWILFPVISGAANSREMRQWCFAQLVRITDTSGLQQAKTIAELARRDVNMAQWMREEEEGEEEGSCEYPTGRVADMLEDV